MRYGDCGLYQSLGINVNVLKHETVHRCWLCGYYWLFCFGLIQSQWGSFLGHWKKFKLTTACNFQKSPFRILFYPVNSLCVHCLKQYVMLAPHYLTFLWMTYNSSSQYQSITGIISFSYTRFSYTRFRNICLVISHNSLLLERDTFRSENKTKYASWDLNKALPLYLVDSFF